MEKSYGEIWFLPRALPITNPQKFVFSYSYFIDSHFPVPEASANTWYYWAMPFLSLYKSDSLSSGLQGDIG